MDQDYNLAEYSPRLIAEQTNRRRTFAIISHPDAGKTTLTEKFLLFSGAVIEAGSIKARQGRRAARSDWMAIEQQRGISISSTVMQFEYRSHTFNLLDTPGHRDFSEDTYRVLSACDSAVMVLDVAKGIEPQTLKLFEVCRSQNLPIVTFLNKYDRPGRDPLELIDEIEEMIGLQPTPITWPVGPPGNFLGVIDRHDKTFITYERTARGAHIGAEQKTTIEDARDRIGTHIEKAVEECSLLEEVGANFDRESFLQGKSSPLFVGSALTNFGVKHLLDAVATLSPPPGERLDDEGNVRSVTAPFSGFVFKMQANMNPSHRDHVAFVRVCSGAFVRGMTVVNAETKRPFATKYATTMFGNERSTLEVAFPGDIVGLVNASELRIGDTLYLDEPVKYPELITFAPELFAYIRSTDTAKSKQFKKGLEQLEREGVIQVLFDPKQPNTPLLGAVGEMQFDVLTYRLESEFQAKVELRRTSYRFVRLTDEPTSAALDKLGGVLVAHRSNGELLALFENEFRLKRIQNDNPDWYLEPLVGSGSAESYVGR
jgi:peptide chain release factor 3